MQTANVIFIKTDALSIRFAPASAERFHSGSKTYVLGKNGGKYQRHARE
jgi:hypothetical protein